MAGFATMSYDMVDDMVCTALSFPAGHAADHRTPSSRVDDGHLDLARSGSRLAAGAGTRASPPAHGVF